MDISSKFKKSNDNQPVVLRHLPVVLAEAISLQKGEQWEWSMEDKIPGVVSR